MHAGSELPSERRSEAGSGGFGAGGGGGGARGGGERRPVAVESGLAGRDEPVGLNTPGGGGDGGGAAVREAVASRASSG